MLFRRLAVFPAAFTLDQAEAVCADEAVTGRAVGPALARLVDRSLVQRVGPTGSCCWRRYGPLPPAGTLSFTLQQVVVLLAQARADTDAATLAGALLAAGDARTHFAVDVARMHAALDGVRARLGDTDTTAALDAGAALTPVSRLRHAREAMARARDTVTSEPRVTSSEGCSRTVPRSWRREVRPRTGRHILTPSRVNVLPADGEETGS